MVKAKVFIFEKQFDGLPKLTDFKVVEEELPSIKDGEFLTEAVYVSVDPYMRMYAPQTPVGQLFPGEQVAKIIESKNPLYPVGKYVVGQFGWRTHTVADGTPLIVSNWQMSPFLLPDFGNLPLSLGLGALGMPGNTVYFGLLEILKPKAGETIVVSGAGGAVGSHVGQVAKILGCRVIGITGSDEKGKWLVNELGFDHYVNYKTDNLEEALSQVAPEGVDCYFDNVGGEITYSVLKNMKTFGRVSICGSISHYNEKEMRGPSLEILVLIKQLKVEGFVVYRWLDRWFEAIEQNKKWIEEGKLKYRETVTEGFENVVTAFINMLKGGNYGKAVVKI